MLALQHIKAGAKKAHFFFFFFFLKIQWSWHCHCFPQISPPQLIYCYLCSACGTGSSWPWQIIKPGLPKNPCWAGGQSLILLFQKTVKCIWAISSIKMSYLAKDLPFVIIPIYKVRFVYKWVCMMYILPQLSVLFLGAVINAEHKKQGFIFISQRVSSGKTYNPVLSNLAISYKEATFLIYLLSLLK